GALPMNERSNWIRASFLVTLMVGLLAVPEADARGGRGGRSGGHPSRRPPRISAPRRANKAPTYKAPRMPHAAAPSRAHVNVARPSNTSAHVNNTQPRVNNAQPRVNNTRARATNTQARVNGATTT